eukprot:3002956-Heterocapsa_arctica.AAC.1
MSHSMMESHAHTQCQEALTERYSLAAKDMNVKFRIVENSRYGWVPHTLIFKWLKDMWGDHMTNE